MRNPRVYPFYNENPTLHKLKVVTTHSGDKEYRVNCVKYPDGFYVKEKDLIGIDGRWVKKTNLIFDHEKGVYIRKNDPAALRLITGVVNIDDKGDLIKGHFSPNPYFNCRVIDDEDSIHHAISYKLFLNNPLYIEDILTGAFYHQKANNSKLQNKNRILDSSRQPYNIVDDKELFDRTVELYNNSSFPIDKNLRKIAPLLKGLTFGFEIETINGGVAPYYMNQYGIIVCRDGSLRNDDGVYPPEYVTVPLSGAKGLQAIKDFTSILSERSDISNRCSLHLHIGGFEYSKIFMSSLFNLCVKIQDEIFDLFPYYKRDEIRYAGKDKQYCKMLPNIHRNFSTGNYNNYIKDYFENIFYFVSGRSLSVEGSDARSTGFNRAKWTIKTRYHWVNITNILFGKQPTIEFRLHTPTTNGDKCINWLFMCAAIIQYASTNSKKCLKNGKISFRDDVLPILAKGKESYATTLVKKLQEYYDYRKAFFWENYSKGDFLSENELSEDKNFKFTIY